jgi:hypothetical protein
MNRLPPIDSEIELDDAVTRVDNRAMDRQAAPLHYRLNLLLLRPGQQDGSALRLAVVALEFENVECHAITTGASLVAAQDGSGESLGDWLGRRVRKAAGERFSASCPDCVSLSA